MSAASNSSYPSNTTSVGSSPSKPSRTSYSTYAEYLEDLSKVDQAFVWLYKFFTINPRIEHEFETSALVADALPGRWRIRNRPLPKHLHMTRNVAFRIVVLEFDDPLYVDRQMLEAVAFHYDINPVFFRHLFEKDDPEGYDELPELEEPRPIPSLAGLCFLHMYELPWGFFSLAAFTTKDPHSGLQTAIIFSNARKIKSAGISHSALGNLSLRQPVDYNTLDARLIDTFANCLRSLSTCSSQRNSAAAKGRLMAESILFYAKLSAHQLTLSAGELERDVWNVIAESEEIEEQNLRTRRVAEDVFERINWTHLTAFNAHSSYLSFAQHHGLQGPHEYADILLKICSKTEKLRIHMDSYLQRQVAVLNLRESQKSIRLADNVNILTQLAFVFLPLSFSSSLFGMNITELGTGIRTFRPFIVTAAAITSFTLLVWWIAKLRWEQVAQFCEFTKGLLKFSLRSPWLALVVCAYIVSGRFGNARRRGTDVPLLFHSLDLRALLDWKWSNQCQVNHGNYLRSSRFWDRQLGKVSAFTTRRGREVWLRDYFYSRWARQARVWVLGRVLKREPPSDPHSQA